MCGEIFPYFTEVKKVTMTSFVRNWSEKETSDPVELYLTNIGINFKVIISCEQPRHPTVINYGKSVLLNPRERMQ